MRIDAYGSPIIPQTAPRAATHPKTEAGELSPAEKFQQLLAEKRHLADSAFNEHIPESELGQHIDLRA
jgi:hypothetical protein